MYLRCFFFLSFSLICVLYSYNSLFFQIQEPILAIHSDTKFELGSKGSPTHFNALLKIKLRHFFPYFSYWIFHYWRRWNMLRFQTNYEISIGKKMFSASFSSSFQVHRHVSYLGIRNRSIIIRHWVFAWPARRNSHIDWDISEMPSARQVIQQAVYWSCPVVKTERNMLWLLLKNYAEITSAIRQNHDVITFELHLNLNFFFHVKLTNAL